MVISDLVGYASCRFTNEWKDPFFSGGLVCSQTAIKLSADHSQI
ncbi:hypothetical protein LFAB_09940 [Lactiplantibacillus fabifermentans T30PCM01]|uniref:Uncharacterized protein n=1 Tax=Lactiplantibacillus fabifermentans T30PCM01 TaxID=1400520 RepID=W6T6V1_9LACO|nr:hypothetical protein LFAB_09940 [Lactiplantibacillus fabifermentans T30PCM01]